MGVLAGCLLSLFLPALPVFFKIIFLSALLVALSARQMVFAGILALLCSWHWQLHAYFAAQQSVLAPDLQQALSVHSTQAQQGILVKIERLRVLDSADAEATLSIQQGKAKGYQLRIRWRNAPPLAIGQHWQLALQLRPVRAHSNPGRRSQDIDALLQRVIAEGYVKPMQPAILLNTAPVRRQNLIKQLEQWTAGLTSAPLLMALTVAERDFSNELWRGVQHSGLGHILTISGLHIGLVFGWGYLLSGVVLKHGLRSNIACSTRFTLQLLSALLLALCYAWLAGFAIPTLRAATALVLVISSRLLLRPLQGRYAWQFLVALLLLLNPFWVLSYSFWLSVLAVAVIVLLAWRLQPGSASALAKLKHFFIFHVLLTGVMSLIGLAFFGGVSVLAIVSNLLFVSWCSLVAIPILLFSLCWSLLQLPSAHLLWLFTDGVFWPLWFWLDWCAGQAIWWGTPSLSLAVCLLLALAILLMLVLRLAWSVRVLIFSTFILALFIPQTAVPRLLLLDSGQNTVLLGRHEQLNWLYLDASAAQLEGLIQHRVLPQLRYQRLRQLDLVLIPRLEREMQPALQLLMHQYPGVRFYSATPILAHSYPCQHLSLDYADAGFRHWALTTADPCVVSVELAGWRVLLPGQLTRWQEQRLMQRYPTLASDIYLLADYGRPSANSLAWLQQLAPGVLLLSASEQGAYRYPLSAVQQRITLLGLPLHHSGRDGAITLDFSEETLKISSQKQQWRLRWLEKPAE